MKLTLYAEKNNGILYALPSENCEDSIRNGWMFPELKYKSELFSGEILSAEAGEEGLFIIPKKFGAEKIILEETEIYVEILPVKKHDSYNYKSLPIGGGGYVTGFAFDEDGVLFCRTDIGGCYSCMPPYIEWKALSHNADIKTEWLCNPLAITCRDNILYAFFGNHTGSFLGISNDKGRSFAFHAVPAFAHGNCMGRSTGERIAVSDKKIFIGTRGEGLLCSFKDKIEWRKAALPETDSNILKIFKSITYPAAEIYASDDITFVKTCGDIVITGTAADHGVFISYDGGDSFEALPFLPEPENNGNPYISQRCAVCGDYLFITFSVSEADRSSQWFSYACDGGRLAAGKVIRYVKKNGKYEFSADITPEVRRCGFSGIDISEDGKTLVCTTVCGYPDNVYLSHDLGDSWEEILSDGRRAVQHFDIPYMTPENNNERSVIHWMSDIRLNPHDSSTAYINTGTGVFRTRNLNSDPVIWEDFSDGIEETVHLGVYSPPSGNVRVIDVVGDLGGFAFTDIDSRCPFTFRDENRNRYITAINADFAEKRPEIAVISPRGNWIGTSKGGAAVSLDGGINWRQLSEPHGLNERSDTLLERIARPNVNPGWVAVSCDGETIIRQIADFRTLPSDCIAVTADMGQSWDKVRFYTSEGYEINDSKMCMKIFSDRCSENIFYAFASDGEVFVSHDKGFSFVLCDIEGELPRTDFSSIEGHGSPDIRVSPHCGGEIMMCFIKSGMFRLKYKGDNIFCSERVISAERCPCAVCGGYGKGNVIFFCGILDGEYGFFRSLDGDWLRINNAETQFGQIRSICGDPRAYGRFFIATGSFGGLYGEMNTDE